jgi:hypothetical protein
MANIMFLFLFIKIELSAVIVINSNLSNFLNKWICHYLAACFRLYNALFSLHTRLKSLL